MTTLTLQVDEELLARATEILAQHDSSVAEAVEDTLRRITATNRQDAGAESFRSFLDGFARFDTGGPYTRDELNER